MRVYIFSLPENLFKAESIKHFLELKGHKICLFDSDSEFYKIISGKTNVADLIIYDFLFFNHNVFNIYDYMKGEDFLIPLIFFNDPTPHQESTEYFWNNILSIIYTEKYFNKDLYSQLISQAAAAIDSVKFFTEKSLDCGYGKTCALPDTVQGICPSGWRLPRKADWETLFSAVGGQGTAGKILKTQTGWNNNGNGMDAVGFSGWPAGDGNGRGSSNFKGDGTYFWSSTESSEHGAYFVSLYYRIDSTFLNHNDKDYAYSVRCVKESVGELPSSSVVSSSSVASSSSIAMAAPCKTESEDNCEYGTLTDNRDGQTYKTVKIGDQIWMAENLNYAYLQPTASLDSSSFCYNDSAEYCAKYGRLYTWAAAMDSVGTWSTNGKGCGNGKTCLPTYPVRGVCPEGWHLPTQEEFETLINAVGGQSKAGKMLRFTSGWNSNGNGTDAYGFSALSVGWRYEYGSYYGNGEEVDFWSSTEYNNISAIYRYLHYDDENLLGENFGSKRDGFSVRCVKD